VAEIGAGRQQGKKKPYDYQFGNRLPLILDTSDPISEAQLAGYSAAQPNGVTLLIRHAGSGEGDGGFLFQYRQSGSDVILYTFRGEVAYRFTGWNAFADFVNHSIGRVFDKDSWHISQQINLRITAVDSLQESEPESDSASSEMAAAAVEDIAPSESEVDE